MDQFFAYMHGESVLVDEDFVLRVVSRALIDLVSDTCKYRIVMVCRVELYSGI